MGLIKLLILIALVIFSIMLWRRLKTWQHSNRQPPPAAEAPRMVRCANCDVHLPPHLAVQGGDHWYCCDEHRSAGHRDAGQDHNSD